MSKHEQPIIEIPKRYMLNPGLVDVGTHSPIVALKYPPESGGWISRGLIGSPQEQAAIMLHWCHSHVRAALKMHGIEVEQSRLSPSSQTTER